MNMTRSQKALANQITGGLQDREIVCLWGNPNGKTHIFYSLVGNLTIGLDGRLRNAIRPKHKEDFTVEILEGVEIPMNSTIVDIMRMKREILTSYGSRPYPNMPRLDVNRKFTELLLDLRRNRIIPCIAQDEIQVMPSKGYSIIKMLNQIRHKGEQIGVAALLSGEFSKRRMPPNFWMHIKEVQIGKVSEAEVEEFIAYVAPGMSQKFTRESLRKIAECHSTLEMSRLVRGTIDYWRRNSQEAFIDRTDVGGALDKMNLSKARIAA